MDQNVLSPIQTAIILHTIKNEYTKEEKNLLHLRGCWQEKGEMCDFNIRTCTVNL